MAMKPDRVFTVAIVVWAVWVLVSLCLTGAMFYATWHFIQKFW